jgi:ketosteroid isomerase-like protein
MSEENLELMRQAVEAWNRGDLDAWAENFAEDIAWYPLAENPENQPVRGKAQTLDFVRSWIAPWKTYKVEVHRMVVAGDAVVMTTTQTGMDDSGTEVTIEMSATGVVRDGKFTEMRWFTDERGALEAAGVSE